MPTAMGQGQPPPARYLFRNSHTQARKKSERQKLRRRRLMQASGASKVAQQLALSNQGELLRGFPVAGHR